MKLPAVLAGWEELFADVADDVREAVVGLAARLAPAIGPWNPSDRASGDEVDGISGLERRGPYDRLLLSEWALADEAPLEFLRRAAEREHLFLDLARIGRAPRRRSVAIFDGGPGQLGAPRIAHLAVIILLAGRAARAGADFWWTVGQSEPASWCKQVDATTLPALFHGRSARRVTRADLDGLLDARVAVDDLWMIGDAATVAPERAHRVLLEDLLDDEPATRRLRARVHAPGQPARTVELEMPPAGVAARIVANPFRIPSLPAHAPRGRELPAPRSRLVFAASAARLLAQRDGGLWSMTIPAQPSGENRTTLYDAATPLSARALAYHASSIWLAHATAGAFLVTQWQRARRAPQDHSRYLVADGASTGSEGLGDLVARRGGGWFLRTVDGELWRLWGSALRLGGGVMALCPSRTGGGQPLAVVSGAGPGAVETIRALEQERFGVIHGADDDPIRAAWFGHAERPILGDVVTRVAAAITAGGAWVQWAIPGRVERREVVVPPGATPVGVYLLSGALPSLVTLSPDRRSLVGIAPGGQRDTYHTSETAIVDACLSPARPEAAVLTASGELVIVALRRREPWLRVQVQT